MKGIVNYIANNHLIITSRIVVIFSITWIILIHVDYLVPLGKFKALDNFQNEIGNAYLADLGDSEISSHEGNITAYVIEFKPMKGGILHYLEPLMGDTYIYYILHNLYEKRFPEHKYYKPDVLGDGNNLHDDIRSVGKGKFSLWHGYIYLSTSDNTSPIDNQRKYYLFIPYFPSEAVENIYKISAGVLLLILMLSAFFYSGDIWKRLLRNKLIGNVFPGIIITLILLLIGGLSTEIYLRNTIPFTDKDIKWAGIFDPVAGYIFSPGATVRWTNNIDFWGEAQANRTGQTE